MGRDLRRYARQTQVRLIIGGILLLFVVGDGLIYLFYGGQAAIMGLLCITMGMVPVILTGVVLWLFDVFVRLADRG